MVLHIHGQPAPIRINADGVALVGDTRVRLETIIAAFHRGDSPEQIADSFDVLTLADIYGVIAYYLNHREEVEAYILEQDTRAEEIYGVIAMNQPEMFSLRTRLLAHKRKSE